MIEIENDRRFREFYPRYEYSHAYSSDDYYNDETHIFNAANNEPCSCASERIDSVYKTADFKMMFMIDDANFIEWYHCTDKMEDFECYYHMRQDDVFDLFIETVTKDGCTKCYGVGPDLWPISDDQLLKRLTRAESDIEDCTPRPGYHKSHKGEIYRCEAGHDSKGIIAFTEADGTFDYYCGFEDWSRSDKVLDGYDHHNNFYPIYMVTNL